MQSKTSNSNLTEESSTEPLPWHSKFCSKAMFFQTVDSLLPIPIIYFLIVFLAIPMNIFLMDEGSANVDGFYYEFAQMVEYARYYGLSTSFLLGCLSALLVYRYLFNNRAANMVHSLPIPRSALFWTQYVAGLSFVIVPNILLLLVTMFACVIQGFFFPEPLLYLFWIQNAYYFFFYSFGVFCAMFTGSPGAVAIYYLVYNFLVAFVTVLLDPIFEMYYIGYTGDIFTYPYVQILTPIFALVFAGKVEIINHAPPDMSGANLQGTFFNPLPEQLELALYDLNLLWGYLVAAVVMIGISLLVYKGRHIESAGEAVAVQKMKPVFRFVIAILGGIAMGIVTLFLITETSESEFAPIILPLFSLGWSVVFAFVAEMILLKTFRVLKYWKRTLLPIASVALIFFAMEQDLTGYEQYVPPQSKVERIEISYSQSYPQDSGARSVAFFGEDTVADWEFDLARSLHLAAVKEATSETTHSKDMNFTIHYHLDSGYETSRSYSFTMNPEEQHSEGSTAELFYSFFNDEVLLENAYNFQNMLNGSISSVEFSSLYDETTDTVVEQDLSEIFPDASRTLINEMQNKLVEAIALDFAQGNIGEKFLERTDSKLLEEFYLGTVKIDWMINDGTSSTEEQLSYSEEEEASPVPLSDQGSKARTTTVAISTEAVNTLAVLEKYEILQDYVLLSNQEYLEKVYDWFFYGSKEDKEKVPYWAIYDNMLDTLESPLDFVGTLWLQF